MRKKFLVAGLSALLILGIVAAVNAVTDGLGEQGRAGVFRGFGMKGFGMGKSPAIGDLGLPENATSPEIREALFQRRLAGFGLTEDSTIRELRLALEEQRQGMIRERLGLSEDAGGEEIQAALAEKAGDKPLRHRGRMGGRGLLGL